MLCDKCKKNTATYHSKTIINGIETNEHLCSECAKKMGKKIGIDNFGVFDVFGSPFIDDRDFGFDMLPSSIFDDNDGFIDARDRDRGILGNALDSIKKGAEKYNEEKSKVNPEIEKLKIELKDAVDKEDYEKAAELKKKITEKENNKKKGE